MLTHYGNRPDPTPAAAPPTEQPKAEKEQPSSIPARVQVAMQLVALTNDHEQWRYWQPRRGGSAMKKPEAPTCQHDALLRACLCLSRYFDGHDIDQPPLYYLPDVGEVELEQPVEEPQNAG